MTPISLTRHHPDRLLRRWCMPRFAISFERFLRASFLTMEVLVRRLCASGAPVRRGRDASSPKPKSSSSKRFEGVMSLTLSFLPCAAHVPSQLPLHLVKARDNASICVRFLDRRGDHIVNQAA